MGSVSEFPLLERNALKLPGRYQDRASARLMAGNGWFAEREVPTLLHSWAIQGRRRQLARFHKTQPILPTDRLRLRV